MTEVLVFTGKDNKKMGTQMEYPKYYEKPFLQT